jgi:3',5'-cyclic AMP phosphodiesterase CpdA
MFERFRLAQISDSHVRADDAGASVRQLKRALAQAQDYRADAVLMTGDLVNDGRAVEYACLADALAGVKTPLFLLPGNHDDRTSLRRAFDHHAYLGHEGPISFVVDDFPVRIVAIDQVVPGKTHGELTAAGAAWLDAALALSPDKPTLVALHHPPFKTHDLLFDEIGLRDSDLFTGVIARHPQVTRIICGHHHRVAFGQCAHAPVIAAPSTCWTYGLAMDAGQPIAPHTQEPPGWMMHAWARTSGFASHFIAL